MPTTAPQIATPAAPVGSTTTSIPLGVKPYATSYYSLGQEICQNLYLENSQSTDSKAEYYLLKIAGLKRFGVIPDTNIGACRCLFTTSTYRTFSVNGPIVREIHADGTWTRIGLLNSHSGAVYMADNGSLVMLVDGINGWILRLSDSNFTMITDQYYPGNGLDGSLAPTKVTYLDTYFIVNVPGSNQYYYSTSYYVSNNDADTASTPYPPAPIDPATQPNGYWNPIYSGSKIGKPDNINTLVNCNNYLWLFGYNSTEVHYDTGNYNGQLFARYQGAIINIGCSAPDSVCVYNNNIFFLGSDINGTLGVFSNDGMSPTRISTRGIETMIENMRTWSDCVGYVYAQGGHSFYVMQFPSASRTLVYDTVTNSWHERTKLIQTDGSYIRWDGMYATENFDSLIVGDTSTSGMYQLSQDYFQNDNPMDSGVNYIRCVKTTPINFSNGNNVRFNWIQIVCSQGTGLITNTAAGVGIDPTIQIAWSNDTGITYSNERTAPLGKQGEYSKRSRVLSCGMGRNRVWRIAMSDPVPFMLVCLLINAVECRF